MAFLRFVLFCVCITGITTVEVANEVLKQILEKTDKLQADVDDLEKVTEVLVEKIVKLEKEKGILEESNRFLQKSGKQQKRVLMVPELPIAFTARIDNIVDHVSPSDVIPFPDVLLNHRGGFDPNSNQFIAPLAGIYVFTCSLLDHVARADGSGVMLHADIVKNGRVLGRVFAHAEGRSYRDQGANMVFVELQMGDKVWVRNSDSPDLSIGGEFYSTFSGYLLWPLE